MRKIHKYELPVWGTRTIQLSTDAVVLSAGISPASDYPSVWVEETLGNVPKRDFIFAVASTSDEPPPGRFVGTAVCPHGLAMHIYVRAVL